MSTKRTIRKTHQSGSWVYATLEALAGGRATVRLNVNGARISNLPATTTDMRIGETVILDYSAGIPPAVIPAAKWETVSAVALQSVNAATPEPIPAALITTDVGVKLNGCASTGFGNTWSSIRFTTVIWDTALLFNPLTPTRITFPVAGVYLLTGKVAINYPGVNPAIYYQLRFYSGVSEFTLPIANDFPLVGPDKQNELYGQTPRYIYRGFPAVKRMNVSGLGAFKIGEWAELQIRVEGASSASIFPDGVSPLLEAQLLGQIGEVL